MQQSTNKQTKALTINDMEQVLNEMGQENKASNTQRRRNSKPINNTSQTTTPSTTNTINEL